MDVKKITGFSFLFFCVKLQGLVVGSSALVSLQNLINFPQIDLLENNIIRSFAWMKNGFTLENASTELSFESVFPVSGVVNCNGGTITLESDLNFSGGTILNGLGNIIAQGYRIHFASSINTLPADTESFSNAIISLGGDMRILSEITILGDSHIQGNQHALIFEPGGALIIDSNSGICLRNLFLKGVQNDNIRCVDSTGSVTFQELSLLLDDNFNFENGRIDIVDRCILCGGEYIFSYKSNQPFTIQQNSSLALNLNVVFRYDPINQASDLFTFAGNTSQLIFNGGVLQAYADMDLLKGVVTVFNTAEMISTTTTAFTFGDSLSPNNDCTINVVNGQRLRGSGTFNYRNLNPNSIILEESNAVLRLLDNSRLNLHESLFIKEGIISFGNNSIIAKANGRFVSGSIEVLGSINQVSLN